MSTKVETYSVNSNSVSRILLEPINPGSRAADNFSVSQNISRNAFGNKDIGDGKDMANDSILKANKNTQTPKKGLCRSTPVKYNRQLSSLSQISS